MRRKSVLYLEVADQIKEDILSGKYPVGTFLPTETELEEMFKVSKITIRRAIEMLATEEFVEKKSGRGTTVLSNRPYNKLSKAGTFTEFLNESGQKVTKKVLQVENLTLSKEMPAYQFLGEEVVHLSRLYLIDEQPYIYFNYYLPAAMKDVSLTEYKEESLYRLMDRHAIEIYKFEDRFEVATLTEAEQKMLQTTETTGLKRIRRSLSPTGRCVEYSEAIYNTKIHPYVIEYEA